jgi:hypothetical protein
MIFNIAMKRISAACGARSESMVYRIDDLLKERLEIKLSNKHADTIYR